MPVKKTSKLIMFYGEECPHCHKMFPLVDKLEKELKTKVKRLETWHNKANEAKRKKADQGECGGVPFFVNEKTKEKLCGSVSYNKLKKWAEG